MTDEQSAEPMTPDDVPDECDVVGCETDIENFPESFVPPTGAEVETDSEGRSVMCDHHHVASRVLAYTREEPPYVDVGLYQECTYYARALAAETFEIPATEKVNQPRDYKEDE